MTSTKRKIAALAIATLILTGCAHTTRGKVATVAEAIACEAAALACRVCEAKRAAAAAASASTSGGSAAP